MSDLPDVPPEDESGEVESPVDGPMPDWMKVAASSGGDSSLDEKDVPDWLQSIRAGEESTPSESEEESVMEPEASSAATSDDSMSDLERLLAEEGIDLGSVDEERPDDKQNPYLPECFHVLSSLVVQDLHK